MYYKNILLFFILIFGVIIVSLITSNISKNNQPPKIIYRYIPRSDDNYVDTAKPAFVSRVFRSMFENASPWVYSLKNPDYTTQQNVNEFYVSQA